MELPYSNLQVEKWNPGATAPLVLPIQLICNTSDDVIAQNIRINSRRPGKWFFMQPAHDREAIICGSGPSISECLDDIRERVRAGGVLIALNGAASFLHKNGLLADYQVILDAQAETAGLVGPAKKHLFASQCHPDTFAAAPAAQMWHLQIEGIDDLIPEYSDDYSLIGAASSVGTTALVIAFALGSRNLHCYGLDSSNKGTQSHAEHQPMNDGEPMCSVGFGGKDYRCSLTMKMQAERFPQTARLLEREGCKVAVHGYGLLPDIWNAPVELLSEREKYQRMWALPAYRVLAPGETEVADFLRIALPPEGASVLDFGCGTGRAALELHLAGLNVTLVDFASNCRDPGAMKLPFFEFDLTEPMPLRAEYGFCTDVMEHIPPQDTYKALENIFASAPKVYFRIDTKPDLCGTMINQTLHVTLMHHEEWRAILSRYGVIVHEDAHVDYSVFYVERSSHVL